MLRNLAGRARAHGIRGLRARGPGAELDRRACNCGREIVLGKSRATKGEASPMVARPNSSLGGHSEGGEALRTAGRETALRLSGDVAAAADFVLPADDAGNGLGVGDVLLG